jgi:uncharacterized protein
VFVQTFEATLRSWMGLPPGMCVFDETCRRGLALEHNGELYSCDHFVEPEHLLGNIGDAAIADMLGSAFFREGRTSYCSRGRVVADAKDH